MCNVLKRKVWNKFQKLNGSKGKCTTCMLNIGRIIELEMTDWAVMLKVCMSMKDFYSNSITDYDRS